MIEMYSHAISYNEKEPGLFVALRIYTYVACCYAAWSNNYSGQEEATICIVRQEVGIPDENQSMCSTTMS